MAFTLSFGKYKGTLITRVPIGYLQWMVNVNHHAKNMAVQEIKRRGTIASNVELSMHAIDRFSQRYLNRWLDERQQEEGIATYLARLASTAYKEYRIAKCNGMEGERIRYEGITWVFCNDIEIRVLKTVM